MKTVYTLTTEQFAALEKLTARLHRDKAPLAVGYRTDAAAQLDKLLHDVQGTATQHVEPKDRKMWQGAERRAFDRRLDLNLSDGEATNGRSIDTIDQSFALFGRRFPTAR